MSVGPTFFSRSGTTGYDKFVLLMHGNGDYVDSSNYAITVTAYNGATTTSSSPAPVFGSGVLSFDGTNDYAQTADYGTPPSTGTNGRFIAECRAYFTDTGVTRTVFGMWDTAGTSRGWLLQRRSTNKLDIFVGNASSGFYRLNGATTTIAANTWYRLALYRDTDGNINVTIDGVLEGSWLSGGSGSQAGDFGIDLKYVLIGAYRNNADVKSEFMHGKIDELAITFGSARTPYSVPTEEYAP